MTLPIDERRPGITGRSIATLTTNNLASASRIWAYNQVSDDEEDSAYYVPGAADIHNITQAVFTIPDATKNLHIQNALSYDDKPITAILVDVLVHQAHIGHGKLRMSPNGDHGANAWVPSSGSALHHTYVNSPVGNPSPGSFLSTTSASADEEFDLPSLPSNATRIHEAIISAWIAATVGTDTGMCIEVDLMSGGVPLGAAGDLAVGYLECQVGSTTPKAASVKLCGLDTSAATWVNAYLRVRSRRGAAGGTPNPHWYLFDVEVLGYYEVNDIEIIDVASFNSLTVLYYLSYTLDFSVWDGTFKSFLLDILAHAPELFLYYTYTGKLSCWRVKPYSSTPSPLDLSDSVIEARPYAYTERTANAVALKWGVGIPNTTSGTSQEDPVNNIPERGSRRFLKQDPSVVADGLPDYKTLDRHMIRSQARAKACAESYLELWSADVDAVDLVCSWAALEAEPGDVVKLTLPELGYMDRTFAVVSKSIDLDEDHVLLTLYDLEYTL